MKLRNQAMVLILAELFFIITSAFWGDEKRGGYLLEITYLTFFTFGGYALAQDKKWLFRYILLCLSTLVLSALRKNYSTDILACITLAIVYFMLFKVLIQHSFFKKNVPKSDRLISGIAGYILLGLFWGGIFMFIGSQHPGSIMNQVSGEATTSAENLYYSFVTITSLGYGDIVPVSPVAKVVAIFAGVSGILFSAIFIAALVGSLMLRTTQDMEGK